MEGCVTRGPGCNYVSRGLSGLSFHSQRSHRMAKCVVSSVPENRVTFDGSCLPNRLPGESRDRKGLVGHLFSLYTSFGSWGPLTWSCKWKEWNLLNRGGFFSGVQWTPLLLAPWGDGSVSVGSTHARYIILHLATSHPWLFLPPLPVSGVLPLCVQHPLPPVWAPPSSPHSELTQIPLRGSSSWKDGPSWPYVRTTGRRPRPPLPPEWLADRGPWDRERVGRDPRVPRPPRETDHDRGKPRSSPVLVNL